VVGYTYDEKPVTAGDLNAQGAMAALLKDALKPNLVQTLEHTPAFVHGGPFANIAHGCNSVTATKIAMRLSDYTITEAGFGADLGAEKFLDIKCRMAGLKPSAVVIVATIRALKYNGGVAKADLGNENLEALEKGMPNLLKHVSNITNVYKLPCVVAINRFPLDTEAELKLVEDKCKELGVNVALSEVWAKGGEGGIALAEEVIRLCEQPNDFTFSYELDATIEAKILFDADKLDVTGAIGMARTFFYAAQVGQPLYTLLPDGTVSDGTAEEPKGCHSVLREYKFKLEKIYDRFLTPRGAEMARRRQAAMVSIYENILAEAREPYETGSSILCRCIEST
jgi:formyltetrahydrofolate synthetase